MVILDVRDVRKRIDEAHRAVEVLELELAPNRTRVRGELPLRRKLAHERLRGGSGERRNATLAGFTASAAEIAQEASLRMYLRAT